MTVKSNLPIESEFGPGQQVDINTVLSVVEDFIQQHDKKNNSTASTEATEGSLTLLLEPQPPGVKAAFLKNTSAHSTTILLDILRQYLSTRYTLGCLFKRRML